MSSPWKRVERGVYRHERTGQLRITVSVTRGGKSKQHRCVMPERATIEDARNEREIWRELLLSEPLHIDELPDRGVLRSLPLQTYAAQWIQLKKGSIRPSTLDRYSRFVREWLGPLSSVSVQDIDRRHVLIWTRWLSARRKSDGEPYAQDSLISYVNVMRGMLKDMAADADVPDPTRRIRAPRSEVSGVKERQTLDAEQLRRFLRAARTWSAAWYPLFCFIALTGCRSGEATGLHVADLDLDKGFALIRRSHVRGSVNLPKNRQIRYVALPHRLVEVLREWLEDREIYGVDEDNPILFPGVHGGYRGSPAVRNEMVEVSLNANMPIQVTPQVLRRTWVTLMRTHPEHQAAAKAQVGHASTRIHDFYTSPTANALKALSRSMDAIFDD